MCSQKEVFSFSPTLLKSEREGTDLTLEVTLSHLHWKKNWYSTVLWRFTTSALTYFRFGTTQKVLSLFMTSFLSSADFVKFRDTKTNLSTSFVDSLMVLYIMHNPSEVLWSAIRLRNASTEPSKVSWCQKKFRSFCTKPLMVSWDVQWFRNTDTELSTHRLTIERFRISYTEPWVALHIRYKFRTLSTELLIVSCLIWRYFISSTKPFIVPCIIWTFCISFTELLIVSHTV